jgi:L-ornithine N5-monooxygenase
LLSILPVRADEIAGSLYEHGNNRGQARPERDLRLAAV